MEDQEVTGERGWVECRRKIIKTETEIKKEISVGRLERSTQEMRQNEQAIKKTDNTTTQYI